MEFGEENIPLLWDKKEPLKKQPSVVEEERSNFRGSIPQRWHQSVIGPDHRRAPGDVPSHDQFVDVVPELPVYKEKQKANTVGAVLYLILLAIYAAYIIASAILVPRPHNHLLKSITCSCNTVLLAITGILQRHLVAEQQKEQRQGYIRFCKDLDWIVHLPLSVLSIGTAGLLLVVVWQPKEWEDGIPPLFLIRSLILVEIAVEAYLIGAYLQKVYRHHAVERHPDIMDLLHSALNPPVSLASVKYNDGGLAEQQAMLLHYQQDNLRYLSEEILKLQETLSKFDRSQDGHAPQIFAGNEEVEQGQAYISLGVDVVHLLAAREQELRAVTAEAFSTAGRNVTMCGIEDIEAQLKEEPLPMQRDQLLAELRLSRSLIGEREADIKHVQDINRQYIEENERVRSMLEEWSQRTAKLEIALEAERLSNLDLQKRFSLLRHQSSDPKSLKAQ